MAGGRKRVMVPLVLGLAAAVVAVSLFVLVQWRQDLEQSGLGAVEAPSAPVALDPSAPREGRFTTRVSYTAMGAPADANVSTEVAWDDDWFFEDPTVYNHELARTCSVLSAIANSESAYYQAGSDSPAYMEQAMAQLGLGEVSTASYRYRSEIVDEVVEFLTRGDDVVAYSVASKRLMNSATGEAKTLLLVSVRGSYGAEWLSDANMGDPSELDLDQADHLGFADAAQEIVEELGSRLDELVGQGVTSDDVALLFCGHSRGAATANLAAAYADDMAQGLRVIAPTSSIYAYTFATPTVTTMGNVRDPLYDNIFNVLNPSDMVPRLPLASWGFARYGRDLWLPEEGGEGFEALHASMRERYCANVGVESPSVPGDVARVDAFERDLAAQIPTQDDFGSLGGVGALARDLLLDMNAMQVLTSHYPNTYIAWMQAVGQDDLRTSR